jgi:hypothetical protein
MKVAIHVTKSDNGPPLEAVLCWVGNFLDISIDYLGESFAGDELIIVMWQDHKDVSRLSFSIYKLIGSHESCYPCH